MTLDVMAEADELLGQVDAHYLGAQGAWQWYGQGADPRSEPKGRMKRLDPVPFIGSHHDTVQPGVLQKCVWQRGSWRPLGNLVPLLERQRPTRLFGMECQPQF